MNTPEYIVKPSIDEQLKFIERNIEIEAYCLENNIDDRTSNSLEMYRSIAENLITLKRIEQAENRTVNKILNESQEENERYCALRQSPCQCEENKVGHYCPLYL